MKLYSASAGEWIQPRRKKYRMACCDCGLVHDVDFQVVKTRNGSCFIQFRVFRNERSTGQVRRYKRLKNVDNQIRIL